MKAEELRIGNWVYLFGDAQPLTKDLMIYLFNRGRMSPSPITLNEEWLLKFGFTSVSEYGDGNFNYWNKEKDVSIDVESNLTTTKIETLFYYRVFDQQRRKLILYVHQLQNLYFCLTGEELEDK